jgi:cytochrome P450 / NADPH-cytochrome P450 reductase
MARRQLLERIPQPPAKPLIGNILTIGAEAPIQSLMRLAQEHGPIFFLDMLGTPIVVVSGFKLVDELSDEKRFDKAVRGALRRIRSFAGDGLFTADTQEPNWAKAHNILLPTFSHRAMQAYHPMMLDIADQMMLKWERLNPDEDIDVVHDMTALTLDTIGLCGFDYRFNSFYRRDSHPFVEAMVRSLETVMKIRGLPLEELVTRDRRRQLQADVRYMNGMVDRIVRERRESPADDQSKQDLLGFMLSGVDKTTGERLDDVNIRFQINTFLIAGHETTSGMLSFAMYFLLNHPDVLAKAYAEVDEVFGTDLSVKPTFAQVNQLTYVSQILKETLRLWPTAPAYSVYPYKDELLAGEYKLKKRTFINILTPTLHRDKSVWGPNPEVFNPDNFSREAEATRPANAFKPFGNGQRACIGRQFAMQEAALVIGLILQRFKLIDHTRYQLKIKETLTLKPDGLRIKVRRRTDYPAVQPSPAAAAVRGAPRLAASARAVPQHDTPLLVLFGSNLGTAEELARQVAEAGEVFGFKTTLSPLDDCVGRLPKRGGVAIVCASYNGQPPDNAAQFCKWLEGDQGADALSGVRYAVFGCGNRDWAATYQTVPRFIDDQLSKFGARRISGRGEGDAREDLDGEFQRWFATLRPLAAQEFNIDVDLVREPPTAPLYQVEIVPKPPVNPIIGSLGAQPLQVLANRELQQRTGPDGADRSTRHIEVKLPAGMTYRAGDHLSIVPSNSAVLVERVTRRFGLRDDDHIRLDAAEGRRASLPAGQPMSIQRLLGDYVELQTVATRKHIQSMAEHTRCPVTKPSLTAFAEESEEASARYKAEVLGKRKSVLDLLEEYPACELPFNVYLEMLPLMVPRYYSISSSPAHDAGRCSITVAVVETPARSGNGIYQGVCSNHLLRQGTGSTVHGVVRETKVGFRLPDDPATPIIMIGPGTGLAPFRGFLQERAALKAKGQSLGQALLFFGCRHPNHDFIYADELKRFADQGIIDLKVAFSRFERQRAYVQDLLRADQEKVLELIGAGAIVYVCGDGSRMEPAVKHELTAMYAEASAISHERARDWMETLIRQNRYVLDVWAGS